MVYCCPLCKALRTPILFWFVWNGAGAQKVRHSLIIVTAESQRGSGVLFRHEKGPDLFNP